MSFSTNLISTIENKIQFGNGGPNIKRNVNNLDIKNAADNTLANLNVAEPTNPTHAATKNYVDGMGSSPNTIKTISFAINNDASQSSITQMPANSVVWYSWLQVNVAYSPGTTISLGIGGNLTLFQATTDNNPEVETIYEIKKMSNIGGSAEVLVVTIDGAPAAGSGQATVFYSTPSS